MSEPVDRRFFFKYQTINYYVVRWKWRIVITYDRHTFHRRVSRGQLAVGWPSDDDDTHPDAMTLHITESSNIFLNVSRCWHFRWFISRSIIESLCLHIFSMNVIETCPWARVTSSLKGSIQFICCLTLTAICCSPGQQVDATHLLIQQQQIIIINK